MTLVASGVSRIIILSAIAGRSDPAHAGCHSSGAQVTAFRRPWNLSPFLPSNRSFVVHSSGCPISGNTLRLGHQTWPPWFRGSTSENDFRGNPQSPKVAGKICQTWPQNGPFSLQLGVLERNIAILPGQGLRACLSAVPATPPPRAPASAQVLGLTSLVSPLTFHLSPLTFRLPPLTFRSSPLLFHLAALHFQLAASLLSLPARITGVPPLSLALLMVHLESATPPARTLCPRFPCGKPPGGLPRDSNDWFLAVFGGIEAGPARRAKENSPAIYRWGSGAKEESSPGGTTELGPSDTPTHGDFFRPCGTIAPPVLLPAMNRWAIIGRPCGTLTRKPGDAGFPAGDVNAWPYSTEYTEEPNGLGRVFLPPLRSAEPNALRPLGPTFRQDASIVPPI